MGILQSAHWRRRLTGLAIVAGITPLLIYLAVHYSDPGDPRGPSGVEIPDYVQPKRSPFTADERQAVRPVLREFITAAVAREDLPRAWELSAPSLRQGVTRKEWNRGDIPVVPYPAAKRGLGTWSYVEYSYPNAVGLEVFVFPKPGSGYSAMTADVELVRGRGGRWRVGYWMPKKFHGPPDIAAKQAKKPKPPARTAAPAVVEPPRPGRAWLLVPFALLSLALLVPVAIALLFWYRGRRAEREYLRSA